MAAPKKKTSKFSQQSIKQQNTDHQMTKSQPLDTDSQSKLYKSGIDPIIANSLELKSSSQNHKNN